MEGQQELPPFRRGGTSFLKTFFNTINTLSGIGLITLPYTLSQAGWLSLVLLVLMAITNFYTGILLKKCLESQSSIKTYPDVGWHAFGNKGKIIISTFMYLQLYLIPTSFLILEADNLHKLFPYVDFEIKGHYIGGKKLFTIISGLIVLPTMWLKDLNLLSFISAGGLLSIILIIFSILWVGAIDGVGFSAHGKLFDLGGIPTVLSLYAFCYGAHPVFPTLYFSMKDRSKFSKVLLLSFSLITICYISMAIIGYLMFGQKVQSQVTLNLPASKVSSKIAIYTTLVGPIAKYAIVMTPLSDVIQSCFPEDYNTRPISILTRTMLLISSVIVALFFPFFDLLVSLLGAILDVFVSILFPCICYLKIIGALQKKWGFEVMIIRGIIVVAILVGVTGTYSSVKDFIRRV